MNCMDGCKYAKWIRTEKGKFHPSGEGYCTWEYPDVVLPNARHFIDTGKLDCEFINRKDLKDCPAFVKAEDKEKK